jgi:prepilin-type N-terminal cleavage/methylation domain-containing protein
MGCLRDRSMTVTGTDMQARGYSLVEMLAIMAIASILLAMATLSFNKYFSRSNRKCRRG